MQNISESLHRFLFLFPNMHFLGGFLKILCMFVPKKDHSGPCYHGPSHRWQGPDGHSELLEGI